MSRHVISLIDALNDQYLLTHTLQPWLLQQTVLIHCLDINNVVLKQ